VNTEETKSKNPAEFPAEFPVGMPPLVVFFFFLFVSLVGGITAWFFSGGMVWAGGVMIVMFIPLLLIIHYVLYIVPRRARVMVGPDGMLAMAEPFVHQTLLTGEVRQAFVSNVKRDAKIALGDKKTGMSFGPYRAGTYELPAGSKAVVLARQNRVLCLYDGETYLIVGPKNLDGLISKVEEALGRPVDEVA